MFRILNFSILNLFGIWNLLFGISKTKFWIGAMGNYPVFRRAMPHFAVCIYVLLSRSPLSRRRRDTRIQTNLITNFHELRMLSIRVFVAIRDTAVSDS